MPGGDGTGPLGLGPITGRGAGFCMGYGIPGYTNYPFGRGYRAFGRGRVGGRGFRNWFYSTGLTGWQRAAGGIPAWNNSSPYSGGYYQAQGAPFVARNQELDSLKAQAEYLKDALETIQKQISELEGKIKDTNAKSG